ncbi:amine oxidase [Dyadobacter diqingensis]|uniref:amine oxidase n=1 Tax=Dyadobacter diqingensis TaxID=2938121 RepID=UPI0020C1C42B|nr:amine oxidase [Dyadobacter diqingensis]
MKMTIENPFKSFWMAGFESTDQLNAKGDRVDFLHITSHLTFLNEDYERLAACNLVAVREGVRWSQVETSPYVYDFSVVGHMIEVARNRSVQQIWDLCHFGFPEDLSPLHPQFTSRFTAFCRAFAIFWKGFDHEYPMIVTPINEVSFISWLGGDVAATSPFCHNNGWQVKYAYMKAYIAGVRELKNVDPGVRILTTEPLVHVSAAEEAFEIQIQAAADHNELQFQVLDMLCGRICPELGGQEDYLDILGCNYYYNNQWVLEPHVILGWNDAKPDPGYWALSDLLMGVYKRYDRPIILSETSHPGVDRPVWIDYVSSEVHKLLRQDVPFWGICFYPIIDRPDWDDLDLWHHSGLWDSLGSLPEQQRLLHEPSFEALSYQQRRFSKILAECENQKKYEATLNDVGQDG